MQAQQYTRINFLSYLPTEIARITGRAEKKRFIYDLPLEIWPLLLVFHDYLYEAISSATGNTLNRHFTLRGTDITERTRLEIVDFLIELSSFAGLRAAKDFILLRDNPINLQRLTHVSMWARMYAAKYTPIHEANIIASYKMRRTLAHPSIPELHVSPESVRTTLSFLIRQGPRMHYLNNHKIYAQMKVPIDRQREDDVVELSGLLSAAQESDSTLTQKLEAILAEHSVPEPVMINAAEANLSWCTAPAFI